MTNKYCTVCKREHSDKPIICNWCEKGIGCRQKKIMIDENTVKDYKAIFIHKVYHKACYNKMIKSKEDKYLHEID